MNIHANLTWSTFNRFCLTWYAINHEPLGHLGCFQAFVIMHKTTVISMLKFFMWPRFELFWVNTKNMIVGQEGKSMFNFVRSCQIVIQSGLPC